MTIGEKIKERREALGMTQEDLAKKSGYGGKAAISRIERSTGRVQSDIILKIAPALGLSPAQLLEGEAFREYIWQYYDIDEYDLRLIDNYRCLTDQGQEKLEQYLYDLLKNPENVIPGVEPFMDKKPFERIPK